MRGMRRRNKIDRMVSEWRGILAGQAILICMILAYVQVVFGWWVYGVACAVACCNSLAIFGMGRALGKRLSERAIGWCLVLNDLLLGYFVFALFVHAMD